MPASSLMSVDLPAPLAPNRAWISPGAMSRSTLSTARVAPKRFEIFRKLTIGSGESAPGAVEFKPQGWQAACGEGEGACRHSGDRPSRPSNSCFPWAISLRPRNVRPLCSLLSTCQGLNVRGSNSKGSLDWPDPNPDD